MVKIDNQSVAVKGLQVRGAGKGKSGVEFDVRVILEHEPESADALPECRAAVTALLKEQSKRSEKADNESKDVITVKLKRDLPVCRYVLGIFSDNSAGTQDMFARVAAKDDARSKATDTPTTSTVADFRASVTGQPSIAAVHGLLKVTWKVDAIVDAKTLVALSSMIGSEWVAGTVSPLQGVLRLEDAA